MNPIFHLIHTFLHRCILGCFLRQTPIPTIDMSKIVKHEVQDLLSESMDDPGCGVFVHWGIKGSGKTAYAACLARRLKGEKGRSVLFLDHNSLSSGISAMVIRKFCEMLPERERSFNLNPTEPPPTSIIVDDFDNNNGYDEGWNTDNHLRNMIKTIAKTSCTGKRFNVLLLVTSSSRAREILGWDWAHIQLVGTPGCGAWKENHVSELFNMYPRLVSSDDRQERLAICTRAGTPEFVIWSSRTTTATTRMKTNAERHALEWEKGVQELSAVV